MRTTRMPAQSPRSWSGPTTQLLAPLELLLGGCHDARGLETELFLQFLQGGRRAEGLHADHVAARTNITLPSQCRALFDGNPRGNGRREYFFAVRGGLAIEQLPGRHADNPAPDPLVRQCLVSSNTERDLAARGDEQDFRTAARRICQHVGTLRQSRRGREPRTVQRRQWLAREHERHRLVAKSKRDTPGLGDFV